MLEVAEKKRERLGQLKQGGEEDKKRAKEEQWTELIGVASGKQALDPARIKKAIKKREQNKVKSAKEWQGRTAALEQQQASSIAKRESNIKMRKDVMNGAILPGADAAKEGRKQGRRPGFEGKKGGGFLNEKSSLSSAVGSSSAGGGGGGGGGGGKKFGK